MKLNKLINILTIIALVSVTVFAESKDGEKSKSLNKPDGSPSVTQLNINKVSTWIYNNGNSDILPNGNSGFQYPKGSNKATVFESGFVWGAKINGEIRVGGSTYRQGLQPGRVLENGQPQDPDDADVRIYRVRRDWEFGSVASEISDEGKSEADIRAQYKKDWDEWPAQYGAPYEDVDQDGQYDPTVDIPGIPGADQTVWFVANDLNASKTVNLYGSQPMGIEMQATFWGYASAGALGNMIFRKYTIINKSSDVFDEMYVSMWSDPDVGDAGDDFAGVDSTLSLVYAYNGNPTDGTYGSNPPAVGFDFFQGPMVDGEPGDTAIFNLKKVPGKKNLGATSNYVFIRGDDKWQDPELGEYNTGALWFWNLLEGRVSTTGEPFYDPVAEKESKFVFPGDPVTGEGWVDGILHNPGDRRLGMVSGPFVMNPGDTQEVVVAEIAAGGAGFNNLQAVAQLKIVDRKAQEAYDKLFVLPSAPAAPKVKAIALDQRVILNWGWDNDKVVETESHDFDGFKFQGYNVYQLPNKSATISDAVRIATYDIVDGVKTILGDVIEPNSGQTVKVAQQFGLDTGIKRFIEIKKNYINNELLYNGSKYYFAVTAYAYNPDSTAVPNNLENPLAYIEVIPHKTDPGLEVPNDFLDPVADSVVTHNGSSDGSVKLVVIDPLQLTGHKYRVTFEKKDSVETFNPATNKVEMLYNQIVWNLIDVTTGEVKLANQIDQSGGDTAPIVDGLQVKVMGAPNDVKEFQVVANAAGPLDPPEGAAADYYGFPSKRPTDRQQVGPAKWFFHTGDNGSRASYEAFLSRSLRNDDFDRFVPYDWEMRFTAKGSYAVSAFTTGSVIHVPFELWCTGINTPDDPSDDYQLIPWILENDDDGTYNLSAADHSVSSGDNDPYTDWIYWRQPANTTPGTAGYDEYVASLDLANMSYGSYDFASPEIMARTVLVSWNGGILPDVNQPLPEEGTIFRIISTKPNSPSDVFEFTAPATVYSKEKAKADVEKINVFPNPYYGVNPEEINKYQRFVTFNHLPQKATIKIVNLAGQMIKVIEKDSESQYQRWDLTNRSGLPVASGLYLAYIDMPELGKTKVLKVAVILEQQILDRF